MSELRPLLSVKLRKDDDKNVQRTQNKGRIRHIVKYSNGADACFPGNILVNIPQDRVSVLGNTLELAVSAGVLEVLDGQHRVSGFGQSDYDYEVPVGAFIGLSDKQKARVFKAINFNAKAVSKSHVYDLLTLTEDGSEGEMLAHQIVKLLNADTNSPFKGRIKMIGSGKGWFNQASLLKPLAGLIDNGCLHNVDGGDAYDAILAYFKAWQHVFPNDFTDSGCKDSLLIRGFGVQVMVECFPVLYGSCHKPDNQDFNRFKDVIINFSSVPWTRESMNGDTSHNGRLRRTTELLGMLG